MNLKKQVTFDDSVGVLNLENLFFFLVRSGKSKEKNLKSVTKETALTSEPLQWAPDRALWYLHL